MGFIMKFPRTPRGVDCIWVIINRLTKNAHFICISKSFYAKKLADIYIRKVIARHEVLVSLITDYGARFT